MTGTPTQSTKDADPRLAEVEAAINSGNLGRAVHLAEQALSAGLAHPALFNLRAIKAESEGRWADSLADLHRAHELTPEDPSILNALGLCLNQMNQPEEAAEAFRKATVAGPEFAQAWNNLGMALLAQTAVEAARAAFEKAAELQPDFPEPRGQLAVLAARRGDRETARAEAGAALASRPGLPDAVRALAEVDLAEGRPADAEQRLREVLSDPRLGPNAHYLAQGLLGDALDRQGRVQEAFEAYQAANQRQFRDHAQRFGQLGLVDRTDELRRGFERDWRDPSVAASKPPSGPARRHIFLIGFMRSGTTLMEQVLASAADAVSLEEREAIVTGTNTFLTGADSLRRLRDADEDALEPHRADYWRRVRAFGAEPAGKVFVDKMPLNGIKLPLIQRLFPEAKIVFAVRDPRDVVFSCFRQRFAVTSHTYPLLTLPTAVQFYVTYMRSVASYQAGLPLAMHRYRHEDLVGDFDGQVQALCEFLELPWDDAMRDIGRRSREGRVASPSARQLVGGLSADGLQQWRRYEQQLAPFFQDLDFWVRQFGYG